METYVLEARSLEHRCQCCGDVAEKVFCDDCSLHAEASDQDAGHQQPLRDPYHPVSFTGRGTGCA